MNEYFKTAMDAQVTGFLPASQRVVLIYLARDADSDGRIINDSVATVADAAGITEKQSLDAHRGLLSKRLLVSRNDALYLNLY